MTRALAACFLLADAAGFGVVAAESTSTPIIVAVLALVGTLGAAYMLSSRKQTKKIEEIHVLVDGRLTEALDEIHHLQELLVAEDIPVPPSPASTYDPEPGL